MLRCVCVCYCYVAATSVRQIHPRWVLDMSPNSWWQLTTRSNNSIWQQGMRSVPRTWAIALQIGQSKLSQCSRIWNVQRCDGPFQSTSLSVSLIVKLAAKWVSQNVLFVRKIDSDITKPLQSVFACLNGPVPKIKICVRCTYCINLDAKAVGPLCWPVCHSKYRPWRPWGANQTSIGRRVLGALHPQRQGQIFPRLANALRILFICYVVVLYIQLFLHPTTKGAEKYLCQHP